MRKRQKLVWANPQAASTARQNVPPTHLGHFTQPATRPFEGEEPEIGSLWLTKGTSWLITGAWNGTEAADGQIAYLSPTSYGPSSRAAAVPVNPGTMAVYLGLERMTEWDGKGWARPVRPVYLIDGVRAAVVRPNLVVNA